MGTIINEFSSQDEEEDRSVASGIENGHHNTNGHHHPHSNGCNAEETANDGAANNCGPAVTSVVVGRCRALFNYTPKLYDELELQPGDILDIHIKQEDGWWLGALRGQVGIFPATYVEEIA